MFYAWDPEAAAKAIKDSQKIPVKSDIIAGVPTSTHELYPYNYAWVGMTGDIYIYTYICIPTYVYKCICIHGMSV
jgi:hypothetical protein